MSLTACFTNQVHTQYAGMTLYIQGVQSLCPMKRYRSKWGAVIVVCLHWHMPLICVMDWIQQIRDMTKVLCISTTSAVWNLGLWFHSQKHQGVPYHMCRTKLSVDINCVCRLPDDKKQCFQCQAWYHSTCVDIPMNMKRMEMKGM